MIVVRRRLSITDHRPNIVDMKYVYPVISRRVGGVSIGINLNPNNACNWRCGYCQVEDLVLGAGPKIELDRMEVELRALLDEIVHGDFMAKNAPEGGLSLKDIAFAGNGEPTTCPDFSASVDVITKVLSAMGLAGSLPVVLITNGTEVRKADVAAGIRRLGASNGEVWFKLDSATEEGMRRINHAPGSPKTHLEKLRVCASLCPTKIQTCLVLWDGLPPSETEQEAYLDAVSALVRDEVQVKGVLLYSIARAPMQPDAERIGKVPDEWLRAFAKRIEAAGLPVTVTA